MTGTLTAAPVLSESAQDRARILRLLELLAETHRVLYSESPYLAAEVRAEIEATAAVYGWRVRCEWELIEILTEETA